jgi:hypothetical protein
MTPEPHRRSGVTLIEILMAGLILLAFLQAAMPLLVQARDNARTQECVRNLNEIQKAKAEWARDHHELEGAEPTDRDLFGRGRYLAHKPVCPCGGTYHLRAVGEKPTCTVGPVPDPFPHRLGG